MSEASTNPGQGSTQPAAVQEVQGHFPNDATMQDALSALTDAGYDRADFSLPEEQASLSVTGDEEVPGNPVDSQDKAQLRTMGTGMAGYAGAVAVAGVTIATGGAAALAIGAAAAVGAGTAAVAEVMGQAADKAHVAARDEQGAQGRLVLAVRVTTPDQAGQVTNLMRGAGATEITPVTDPDKVLTAGYSAASWTGN